MIATFEAGQKGGFLKYIKKLNDLADDMVGFEIGFDPGFYSDTLFYQSDIFLPQDIRDSGTKRKSEFYAGRLAAKRCLERYDLSSTHILAGDHREPLWPNGVIGSITHTDNQAIAVLASTADYQSLGVDIENWLCESTANEISSLVLTPEEFSHQRASAFTKSEYITLAFSAKESLFKAVFPFVQTYLNFSDTKIVSINEQAQTLDLYLSECSKSDMDKRLYRLHYMCHSYGVYTALYIPGHHC